MNEINNVLTAWILFFALVMFVISLVAYSRIRNIRVLMVALAFGVFSAKGVLLTMALIFAQVETIAANWSMNALLDVMILFLLAASVLMSGRHEDVSRNTDTEHDIQGERSPDEVTTKSPSRKKV